MSDPSTDASAFERVLTFEGVHNVRDIGGYPTRFGRPTRWRTIFRAASLREATPADREQLRSLGVVRIFDLRSFPEIGRDGYTDLSEIGAEREHVPIFRDTDISPEALIARRKLYTVDFAQVYLIMLREGAIVIRRIVEAAGDEPRPLLIHCTGGKDRTGVVSAVLLTLAGADRETVIADYALTSEHLPVPSDERIEQLRPHFGLTRDEYLTMHGSEPGSMARTLDGVEREYGSIEGYLRGIGLSDDAIERARERLLEEAPLNPR